MEFDKVIKDRCAVRDFKVDKVSDELIDKILMAGNLAPTAKNLQPQKILVVKSEEGLAKIDAVSPCRYNAPVCLVVCGDEKIAFSKENSSTYVIDACIVATHMMLEATNLGVDNIWIEMFDKEKLVKEFNLEEGVKPVCLIPLGYRTVTYKESPMHSIRKDINDIVTYV